MRSDMSGYIKKQLGQRIKYLRKSLGLTQDELAEKTELSTRGLGNIETGRCFMSADKIENFIDVLEIDPYELFIFDKEAPKDVVYNDVLKKLEKFKNNKKRLYAISAFLDALN